MKKIININKDIYTICEEDGNVINILKSLGFNKIVNPLMRTTAGRMVTLKQGAEKQNISLEVIEKKFREEGYEVIGIDEKNDRVELIKNYLDRLNNNEDIESVRRDFVKDFSNVEAIEIAQAEQSLIEEGFDVKEVRKLCDVHSALFHQDANNDLDMKTASFSEIQGHPLNILTLENKYIEENITEIEKAILASDIDAFFDEFKKLKNITPHYKKKGELIYPILANHSITGPSEVMWDIDDQIRAEIKRIIKEFDKSKYMDLLDDIKALLLRIKEMIFKEEKILYPMSQDKLDKNDWYDIYRDFTDYGYSYSIDVPKWSEYMDKERDAIKSTDSSDFSTNLKCLFDEEVVIQFPSGVLTLAQLDGLLKTMPMEITFIDHNNINKYFSEHCPLFQRPLSALNRNVASCHPPKAQYMMNKVIEMFREKHTRTFYRMDTKGDRCILVRYYGVYDRKDKFMGVLELVEDFKDYFNDIKKTMEILENNK